MVPVTIAQPAGLISVLCDKSARLDERDDAAIDLGRFDEPEALAALVAAATDATEDNLIVGKAGESIGEIWQRTGRLDLGLLERLLPSAQREVKSLLQL